MTVSTKSHEDSHKSKWMIIHYAIIILIIINIIVSLITMKNNDVKTIVNEIEATKVWGTENYEKLQKIMQSDAYKENYAQNLDAMIMQMESSDQASNTLDIPTSEDSTITSENIQTWSDTNEVTLPETRSD
jgi:hypothetical protein